MYKLIVLAAAALLATACTEPNKAQRVLEDAGYTNVKTGGYAMWACSEKYHFATRFTATSRATGRTVTGAVCSGMFFKNTTIRLD